MKMNLGELINIKRGLGLLTMCTLLGVFSTTIFAEEINHNNKLSNHNKNVTIMVDSKEHKYNITDKVYMNIEKTLKEKPHTDTKPEKGVYLVAGNKYYKVSFRELYDLLEYPKELNIQSQDTVLYNGSTKIFMTKENLDILNSNLRNCYLTDTKPNGDTEKFIQYNDKYYIINNSNIETEVFDKISKVVYESTFIDKVEKDKRRSALSLKLEDLSNTANIMLMHNKERFSEFNKILIIQLSVLMVSAINFFIMSNRKIR